MAQYVVHKIGFWYTDDCYEVGEEKGTVMGITRTLEEAQAIKKKEDIQSLKWVVNPVNFYYDSDNFQEIDKRMVTYFQSEFNLTINHNAPYFELPKQITDEQAVQLLSIMELSFHNIVEYGDDEVIDVESFNLENHKGDLDGF